MRRGSGKNSNWLEFSKQCLNALDPTEKTFVKKWFTALTDTKHKVFYQELKIFWYEYRTYTAQIEKNRKWFNKIKRNLKKPKHPKSYFYFGNCNKLKFPVQEMSRKVLQSSHVQENACFQGVCVSVS